MCNSIAHISYMKLYVQFSGTYIGVRGYFEKNRITD
jgi:hypothetical protein